MCAAKTYGRADLGSMELSRRDLIFDLVLTYKPTKDLLGPRFSPEFSELVWRMLDPNPATRITAEQIMASKLVLEWQRKQELDAVSLRVRLTPVCPDFVFAVCISRYSVDVLCATLGSVENGMSIKCAEVNFFSCAGFNNHPCCQVPLFEYGTISIITTFKVLLWIPSQSRPGLDKEVVVLSKTA